MEKVHKTHVGHEGYDGKGAYAYSLIVRAILSVR